MICDVCGTNIRRSPHGNWVHDVKELMARGVKYPWNMECWMKARPKLDSEVVPETAESAWFRAFEYANRHGWDAQLDGVPDYVAP